MKIEIPIVAISNSDTNEAKEVILKRMKKNAKEFLLNLIKEINDSK